MRNWTEQTASYQLVEGCLQLDQLPVWYESYTPPVDHTHDSNKRRSKFITIQSTLHRFITQLDGQTDRPFSKTRHGKTFFTFFIDLNKLL